MFKHRECGGTVLANLGRQLKIVSPGCRVSLDGILPGVMEIRQIDIMFCGYVCLKCSKEFNEDEFEELEVECFACSEYKPVSETIVTDSIPMLCEHCLDVISGEEDPSNDNEKRVKNLLSLPKEFKRDTLINIMRKPVDMSNNSNNGRRLR